MMRRIPAKKKTPTGRKVRDNQGSQASLPVRVGEGDFVGEGATDMRLPFERAMERRMGSTNGVGTLARREDVLRP